MPLLFEKPIKFRREEDQEIIQASIPVLPIAIIKTSD